VLAHRARDRDQQVGGDVPGQVLLFGVQEQDGLEQVHAPDLEIGHHHPGRILLVVLDGQQEPFKLAASRQDSHRCTPVSLAPWTLRLPTV